MTKKKIVRAPRPSRLDTITTNTAQNFAHLSTTDIARRRVISESIIEVSDMEIAELSMRLNLTRATKASNEAIVRGLNATIAKR